MKAKHDAGVIINYGAEIAREKRSFDIGDFKKRFGDLELMLIPCAPDEHEWDRARDKYLNHGHTFALYVYDGQYAIMAGCREKTPAEFRKHVRENYPKTVKAAATLAILDRFDALIKKRKAAEAKQSAAKKAKGKK